MDFSFSVLLGMSMVKNCIDVVAGNESVFFSFSVAMFIVSLGILVFFLYGCDIC